MEANDVMGNVNFKPILFSTPMVQAILRGEKTQTRRIIKLQKDEVIEFDNSEFRKCFLIVGNGYIRKLTCPYKVGDVLWVRETWQKRSEKAIEMGFVKYYYKSDHKGCTEAGWKPSIFMPKAACRIFLKLKSIRIERVNDISENDAINEGVKLHERGINWLNYLDESYKMTQFIYNLDSAQESYRTLWTLLNGRDSWNKNPFVWVYEFERTDASFTCNVECMKSVGLRCSDLSKCTDFATG